MDYAALSNNRCVSDQLGTFGRRRIDSIHARAIIGRKRGLAGIGTKLVGVKLLNTLQQVSKLTSTN